MAHHWADWLHNPAVSWVPDAAEQGTNSILAFHKHGYPHPKMMPSIQHWEKWLTWPAKESQRHYGFLRLVNTFAHKVVPPWFKWTTTQVSENQKNVQYVGVQHMRGYFCVEKGWGVGGMAQY